MRTFEILPNQFRVADLLTWQREGTLNLNPPFQRRSVWRPGAKGYLVDTVARGLPIPLLFLRERLDLDSQRMMRDVVDGQQRLRTLFAFIDPKSLKDFKPEVDHFFVSRNQNLEMAGKAFNKLDATIRNRILSYKFSVQVLPPEMDDRDVLQVFARINSTGMKLNKQELRNAEFFGEFKTAMYGLAYEQFERWRSWRLLSDDQLSRMTEVELTSDLVMNMIDGLSGRSAARLDKLYARFDVSFPRIDEVGARFRFVMDAIDEMLGNQITSTVFNSEIHFFTLFVYIYDLLWGLGSELDKGRRPNALATTLLKPLLQVDQDFKTRSVPADVLDAVTRSSTDLGRRRTRLSYMAEVCSRA